MSATFVKQGRREAVIKHAKNDVVFITLVTRYLFGLLKTTTCYRGRLVLGQCTYEWTNMNTQQPVISNERAGLERLVWNQKF